MNAGFKDDDSNQHYDFIELERMYDSELELEPFRLVYTNSSGNHAGEITFAENLVLSSNRLILGASVNPQYSSIPSSPYVYNFGTAGLASTAGKLELYHGENLIDEVCWGKIECEQNYAKFSTKAEDNTSIVRCEEDCPDNSTYVTQKYYPEPNFDSIAEKAPESAPPELSSPEPDINVEPEQSLPQDSCDGIVISEIYSYYINSPQEQFIELYNPSQNNLSLTGCSLEYKTSSFALDGVVSPGGYYLFQDTELALTKNPTATNAIIIKDAQDAIVASVNYPHGQRKGVSYALFGIDTDDSGWLQTYSPTPGAPNKYQEFQSCPSGKVINKATGNCIKEQENTPITCPAGKYLNPLTRRCKTIETAAVALAPCKEGYERNPETNRCRKKTTVSVNSLAPCKEGYERNPETNRCRKIRENDGESVDYAPTPVDNSETYQNPKVFTALATIVIILAASIIYVIYQYRRELCRVARRVLSKFRRV